MSRPASTYLTAAMYGLGAEFVVGAAALVAHPPGGARGGWELGQVTVPSGLLMRRVVGAQLRPDPGRASWHWHWPACGWSKVRSTGCWDSIAPA